MSTRDEHARPPSHPKRADAQLNKQTILDIAATLFVTAGVDVPIRDIAAKAGVGTATIYRHFPTRADLIVAVYRYQVDACVQAGPELLISSPSPYAALERWIGLFVDFLITKHGLAAAMQSGKPGFAGLQVSFLDRLLPVCAELLAAGVAAGEIHQRVEAFELMYGVGNLCVGMGTDPRYDVRRLVALLIGGLRRPTA